MLSHIRTYLVTLSAAASGNERCRAAARAEARSRGPCSLTSVGREMHAFLLEGKCLSPVQHFSAVRRERLLDLPRKPGLVLELEAENRWAQAAAQRGVRSRLAGAVSWERRKQEAAGLGGAWRGDAGSLFSLSAQICALWQTGRGRTGFFSQPKRPVLGA